MKSLGRDELVGALGLVAAAELELELVRSGFGHERAARPPVAAAPVDATHRGDLAERHARERLPLPPERPIVENEALVGDPREAGSAAVAAVDCVEALAVEDPGQDLIDLALLVVIDGPVGA